MTINDLVEKIYVISLTGSSRRDYVKNELNKYDIRFEFFDAIDGMNRKPSFFEKQGLYSSLKENIAYTLGFPRQESTTLRGNVIACALSHVYVAKKMIEDGVDNALILEDDIEVNSSNIRLLDKYYSHIPKYWDLIYLGYYRRNKKNRMNLFKYRILSALHALGVHDYIYYGKNLNQVSFNKYYDRAAPFVGTHAYIITNKTAGLICNMHLPVYAPPDELLMYLVKNNMINAFAVKYKIFRQNLSLQSELNHNLKPLMRYNRW